MTELIDLFHLKITKRINSCLAWFYSSPSYLFAFLVPSSKLSVVVVRKKCMLRFFMEVNRTLQNPPLGTVVDSEATRFEWQVLLENQFLIRNSLCMVQVWPYSVRFLSHIYSVFPFRYDFYLISQVACRGTVNPTYYNVIYDDNALKPDHMQRLTFKLCHLYYNWPVSELFTYVSPDTQGSHPGVVTQFSFVSLLLAQCLTFHKGGMNE